MTHQDGTESHTLVSETEGQFHFTKIPPGPYLVVVNAEGFAPFASEELVVAERQAYEVPAISLAVATVSIEATVRPPDLIAAQQIKAAERQRLVGVIPNFYTSYIYDAATLTWKQKFSLATRGTFDPVAFIGVGLAAVSSRPIIPIPDTDRAPRDTANATRQSSWMGAAATS